MTVPTQNSRVEARFISKSRSCKLTDSPEMYESAFNPDWAIVPTVIIIILVITLFTFVYYYTSLCVVPSPTPPQMHSLDNSSFRKLPLELVGYIAECLTPSSAACFTLTCKPIWFILGNQYLDRLWAKDFEPSRRTFLKLLDKDMPYHIVCLQCNQLH